MVDLSAVGMASAFAAGAISFLSPCVLPLVPGYVSYVAGRSVADRERAGMIESRLTMLGLSVCFVLGFATVFVVLGASATALGQLLVKYRYELNVVGGTMVILFGLFMLGVPKLAWLQRDLRFHAPAEGGQPLGTYALGLAFGFGWSPCIGPVLGAILTVAAAQASVGGGMVLLAMYSLGLGVPFVLAALFTGALARKARTIGRLGRSLQQLAGVVMVVMGIAMMTGQLSAFSFWLLDNFPVLGNIG